MIQTKHYVGTLVVMMLIKFMSMGFFEALQISTDDNYQTECIMHNPPTPVGYESYYREGPVYIVIYEGLVRWSSEKCTERECVDVKEYRRAKLIVSGVK